MICFSLFLVVFMNFCAITPCYSINLSCIFVNYCFTGGFVILSMDKAGSSLINKNFLFLSKTVEIE